MPLVNVYYKTVKIYACPICGTQIPEYHTLYQQNTASRPNYKYMDYTCSCSQIIKIKLEYVSYRTYIAPVDVGLIGDYPMGEGAGAVIVNAALSVNKLPNGVVNDPVNMWFIDPVAGPVLAHASGVAGVRFASIAIPPLDWSLGLTVFIWSYHNPVGVNVFHGAWSMDDGIITYDLYARKDFTTLAWEFMQALVPISLPFAVPNGGWVLSATSLAAGVPGAPVIASSYIGLAGLNLIPPIGPTPLPTPIPYTFTVGLGTFNVPAWEMDGYTANLKIYNRAMNIAEINARYTAERIKFGV